jgi:protein translocase SecG subunit
MSVLEILLLILALIIILITMIQAKGTGLSIVPGTGDFGKFERRGPEKTLHQATIILVVIFVVLSAYSYFIS